MEGQGINQAEHAGGFSAELTGWVHKPSFIFHREIPSFMYLLTLSLCLSQQQILLLPAPNWE